MTHPEKGFTLIELLVGVGIVAVLAVGTYLALNPGELLKQARDSQRLADVAATNKALAAYQADVRGASMGTSSIVYVSLPSASSTCGTYSLGALASGYSYQCAPTSTVGATDGTGWMPVNFGQMTGGSPLSVLPVDPVNTATGNKYYTYMAQGNAWALSATLESAKYLAQSAQRDGGSDTSRFEIGSDISLLGNAGGLNAGLIGFWRFDEGSGTVANDTSGSGDNGTLVGSPTWLSGANCKTGSCLQFGASKYVSLSSLNIVAPDTTVSFWMKWNGTTNTMPFGFDSFDLFLYSGKLGYNTACSESYGVSSAGMTNTWVYVTAVFSQNQATTRLYVNGVNQTLSGTNTACLYNPQSTNARISGWPNSTGTYEFQGTLDEVRMYSRALSATEVAALYAASQ